MKAYFGPGGNCEAFKLAGGKSTLDAPAWLEKIGLDAYEYEGGNGIRGGEASFRRVGDAAREAGILMSLHAPYYISLSGIEEEKRLKSIEYMKQSLDAARWLGADIIVIHTGSAAKISRDEAMRLAADTLSRALEEFEGTVYGEESIRLGLETMGKKNQLGTLDEVIELCRISPRLVPVIDFGHMNAMMTGGLFPDADSYRRVFDKIGDALGDKVTDGLHCHFSKIEYTSAGEKKHLTFSDTVYGPEFYPLAEAIARENLSPRIICESDGTMAEDALAMKNAVISLM